MATVDTLISVGVFIFVTVILFKAFKEPLKEFGTWAISLFAVGKDKAKEMAEGAYETRIIYE